MYFYLKCIFPRVIYLKKSREEIRSMYPRRGFWTTRFSTRNIQSDSDGSDDTQGNRAEIICGLDCVDAGEDASPFRVQDSAQMNVNIKIV